MVTLEENRWGLKGSNSTFFKTRRGKCHHFWMAQKAQRCAELRNHSTLTTSHKLGPGLSSRCTYHPSNTSRLIVLASSHAIRLISLFTATCVTSLCNSGGLRHAPPKTWKLLGQMSHLSPSAEVQLSACIWGSWGLLLPLPAWEGGSCLACMLENARWLCVCWGSLPELPPDGAIARLHC